MNEAIAVDPKALLEELYAQPEEALLAEIAARKQRLGDRVLILGHHYQREEVIRFADATGDSLKLARIAAESQSPFIVFCGVHFMAETADILTRPEQIVILPDPDAGCSMADMADEADVRRCWEELETVCEAEREVVPITYINSAASLKAFCGEHGGVVCTSSNAAQALQWGLRKRSKVLFFPDRHLGENTALRLGIREEEIVIWDSSKPLGGLSPEAIQRARLILWNGFCSVHQLFRPEHVDAVRRKHPDVKVLAHPECMRAVCEKADFVGSTEQIIRAVEQAPSGTKFAIATELNLVNRLRLQHPDKPIWFLAPTICMCATMFRTDPQHLLASLVAIEEGGGWNRIRVPEPVAAKAKIALDRMLQL